MNDSSSSRDGSRVHRHGDDSRVWTDLHGGQGPINVERYLDGALPWALEIEMWTIPPGGSEGIHVHDDEDPDGYRNAHEVYVIVEGRCEVIVGDERQQLGPGDAFTAGALVPRGITNVGSGVLRLLLVSDPER